MESRKIEDTAEDAADEVAEEVASGLVDRLRPTLDEVQDRLKSVNDRVSAFVREHPAACVVGAVALGYLAARLARRERS